MTATTDAPASTTVGPCGKVMQGFLFVAAVTMFCLTASLPINKPSNQIYHSQAAAPELDTGSTAWMVVAAIFGVSLGPVIGYFFSNLYGYDTNNFMKYIFVMTSIITITWVVLTFSLVWGDDAEEDNILGYPQNYFMFHNVNSFPHPAAPRIPSAIFAIFELSFAILGPVLIITALYNRVNINGLMGFLWLWHIALFTPVAHMFWNPNGIAKDNHVQDFSGGAVIAILSAATIVAGRLYLKLRGSVVAQTEDNTSPHNKLTAFFLVSLLWFFVNAGKAYAADGVASQSIINSVAAVAASTVLNYCIDGLFDKNFNTFSIINSALTGLIVALPSSGYFAVGGTFVVSAIATFAARVYTKFISKECHSEPLSITTLFGFVGTVSFLLTGMFCYQFINYGSENGLTFGDPAVIRHNLAALLALWVVGVAAAFILFFISGLLFPLVKDLEQDEKEVTEDDGEVAVDASV